MVGFETKVRRNIENISSALGSKDAVSGPFSRRAAIGVTPPRPLVGAAGRMERALRNFLESFALFAAAVLVAHLAGRHSALTVWGAQIYVVARVLYVPLYAWGVPLLRSAVWGFAGAGIVMILAALI